MHCENCGKVIPEGKIVCPNCDPEYQDSQYYTDEDTPEHNLPENSASAATVGDNVSESNTHSPVRYRLIFIILSIVAGNIGVHNFYAGHGDRAVIQLFSSVFGIAFFVSGMFGQPPSTSMLGFIVLMLIKTWTLIEAGLVYKDGNGKEMSSGF